MNISFIPISKADLGDKAFEKDRLYNCHYFVSQWAKKLGHCLHTVDIMPIESADFIILIALDPKVILQIIKAKKQLQTLYIPFEPPVVNPWHRGRFLRVLSHLFPYILSWNDKLIDNKHFFKYDIPYYEIREVVPNIAFSDKKLVTMVVGYKTSCYKNELYSERLKVIEYFEEKSNKVFEFFGMGWPPLFESYKGTIKNKLLTIASYKFAFCFENQKDLPGYMTEKILDCFNAKVVPIYWGANNINEVMPQDCYINYKDYDTNDDLYRYLYNMGSEEYQVYLDNAQLYLNSSRYREFLPENFAQRLLSVITELPKVKQPRQLISYSVLMLILYEKLKHKVRTICCQHLLSRYTKKRLKQEKSA